jgi:hypothetical protein
LQCRSDGCASAAADRAADRSTSRGLLAASLREDLQEGIGGQILADGREGEARRRFAPHPYIDGGNLVTMLHHKVGEVELAIEFEGTRMNRQGTRGRAGLGGFVDDAHLDTELREPERQNETGRAGADNENVTVHHALLRFQSTVSHVRPPPALRPRRAMRAC